MNNNWVPNKCTCVPSGICHSMTLLGCPHKHYFNEKNEWTCDINGTGNNNCSKYRIVFYNDMGHLMIKSYNLFPEQIRNFAYEKIKNKINYATDNDNLGCQFYILKNNLNNTWEVCLPEQTNSLCEDYKFNNSIITLDYSQLDKFNPKTMKWSGIK